MIATAIFALLSYDAGLYAVYDYRMGHSLPFGPVAVLLYQAWLPTVASLPLVILLFPDGRLPSPRWRWVLWSYLGLICLYLTVLTVRAAAVIGAGRIRVDALGQLTVFDQSSGRLADVRDLLLAGLIAFWLSFVGYQVLSWRRSAGERRQQLKWLLSGGVVAISLGLVVGSFATGIVSGILSFAVLALPVGIGVGILKYRLYEIDRIISPALGYVIVTGLLIGVYVGLVLLASHALKVRGPVPVAAATLAAAALFSPLRRRVQQMVDRRFNRARYDSDKIVTAFAAQLQDAVDPEATRAGLLTAIAQALEPAHASIWIKR
ncbi:MAG: hypothetical protein M3Z75_28760 [Actinomycetota bacterium]|nr:hypothetical protein [Actinomycetota bacterium]